ncbi:unnamed protein product [Urochloa humidicola]
MKLIMEPPRRRRRAEPAAIDITWVSCRGVRSSLPFHTPCLYASVFVAPSSARGVHGSRRPHRVKTPTDRAGGANPEWDAPLRLYLPADDPEAAGKEKDTAAGDDVLLLRFEIKAEVAVLGDKLAASAAVPVPGLVADGRTRRVSYQMVGPDGRHPNGVISFSYAFHRSNGGEENDGHCSGGGEGQLVAVTAPPPYPAASPTTPGSPRLYPAIDLWPLAPEPIQVVPIYPPPPVTRADAAAGAVTVASSRYYPPPPPATPPAEPVAAVYPPPLPETATSSCSVYPPVGGMYPAVDLAPVSCYPPAPAPALYGVECGYAAPAPAPGWGWDDRCLYG